MFQGMTALHFKGKASFHATGILSHIFSSNDHLFSHPPERSVIGIEFSHQIEVRRVGKSPSLRNIKQKCKNCNVLQREHWLNDCMITRLFNNNVKM